MVRLDSVNRRILEILQEDGRISLSELARRIGRSETTVRDRLRSLQSSHVLQGCQAVVDEHALGYPVRAFVRADLDLERLEELHRNLERMPQVVSCAITAGPRPLLVEVLTPDLQHIVPDLQARLGGWGLRRVQVEPVLRTLMSHRPPRVAAP